MRVRSLFIFGCLAAACLAVGAVGSLFTPDGGWYSALRKPSWNPPSWTFGVVWTILYLLMALAATIVWLSRHGFRRAALAAFFIQLLINATWTPVFFGARSIAGGLAVILVLWIAIVVTTVLFWCVRSSAGALMLPCLTWVSFAGILNWTIWRLN